MPQRNDIGDNPTATLLEKFTRAATVGRRAHGRRQGDTR
jgi:hypothetical protein